MENKKIKQKITKNTLIMEIVERYPKTADKLVSKYSFHCIGCSVAEMENINEGATAHGMSKKEIEKMIEDLNVVANKEDLKRKKK